MNILLCGINAKYIHTNLAIRQIKGYVENNSNYLINTIEYTINNYVNDILKSLYKQKPDILGFSCYIWNIEMVKKLVVLIKNVLPETIIILGGPEVSYNSEALFSEIPCDYIISGEGEQTFCELLDAINDKHSFESVGGLTFITNGKVVATPKEKALDMVALPFPYKDFDETENRICYYEASRGCPFGCRYCLSSIEKGVRFAPIEKVKKELQIFLDNKVQQVKFVDRTFNCNKKFALEIILFLIENDNSYTNFHFEVEASLLDEETLELLSTARRGLFQLEIGIQSTNEQILKAIDRKNDMNWIEYCVGKLQQKQNIHLHLDLIAGLPLEDFKSFKKSFNDVYRLIPNQLQLGFLKVLKGSAMEKLCSQYNIKYSPYPPYEVLSTDSLTYDEVLKLKGIEEMVELYYNSNRFYLSTGYIMHFFNDPFDFYQHLSEFKKQKGMSTLSHNKNDAYAFLIEFCESFLDNEEIQNIKAKLKFDFLCHERPRSNPDWAEKNMLDNNELYDLVVKQKAVSELLPEYSDIDPKQLLKLIHIERFPIDPFSLDNEPSTYIFDYNHRRFWGEATAIPLE